MRGALGRVIVLAALVLLLPGCGLGNFLPAWQFYRNQAAFRQAAAAILTGEDCERPAGVLAVDVWHRQGKSGAEIVDFSLCGWGLGPATSYWGIYTTTDGGPAGFQGASMSLREEEGGWAWREEDGDNAYVTVQVAPGWYCYRMDF